MKERAEKLIGQACRSADVPAEKVRLGKVSELAQSFSLTAPDELIDKIEKASEVKEVIRSGDEADIAIREVRRSQPEKCVTKAKGRKG